MKDLTAWRPRSAAYRLHHDLVHRLRRNIIGQRMGRRPSRARSIHLEGIGAAPHALPAHHLAASNLDLDDLTSTLNLFDAGHVNG